MILILIASLKDKKIIGIIKKGILLPTVAPDYKLDLKINRKIHIEDSTILPNWLEEKGKEHFLKIILAICMFVIGVLILRKFIL